MGVRVGITGVSGYGGRELLRLCAGHPAFEVVYVSGDSTAGQRLDSLFPALSGQALGGLVVQRFEPREVAGLDLLFASLPTGQSREPLAQVPAGVKIVDVGGDHRFVEGWTYGLTELPGAREEIARSRRVADPGCYSVTSLLALAPLVAHGVIEPEGIVVDAKSGVSGAGRGGGPQYGYADTNEDVVPYKLLKHDHVPEMRQALERLAGGRRASLAFSPHLVPMTRGILATCYGRPRGEVTTAMALEAARAFYEDAPFVRVVEIDNGFGLHSKWATGSNLAFVSYVVNPETGLVVALGVTDNLGKGAAGQAVQNANLMTGQAETAGLLGLPLSP
ncbi:MAG TPA: N-acetyl-gamma-glutamyl-phosphate reductase [Chloroflexota bacterium]|nr:N-acetyl-gamma-glutamyl-phosphate reductase [Chloroflexota bacterium]